MSTKKEVKLNWHYQDNMTSKYSTNLVVQHTEHEFVLSFFEATPPILLSDKDIDIDSVTAECVARIVIAPGRLQQFIDVLQKNVDIYKSNFLKDGEE